MRRLLFAVAAVIATAALASGCGGGSSSSTTGATSTTTTEGTGASPEYVNQGNEICRVNREANLGRLQEFEQILEHGLTTQAERDKAAEIIRGSLPDLEAEKGGFEKLTPPAGLEHTQDRLISKIRWAIALERLLAKALESGSAHEVGVLFGRLARNELAVRGAAIHLGLKVCGKLLGNPEGAHGLA